MVSYYKIKTDASLKYDADANRKFFYHIKYLKKLQFLYTHLILEK